MSHTPTNLDVASDLRRSIYASFSKSKFEDVNFRTFFNHALEILKKMNVDRVVLKRIQKSQDESLEDNKRREDLLTASILLQNN